VGLYIAAMRALVIQHKSLGGFASDTVWMAERYDEIASDDARTIMAGVAQFDVYVEAVTKATGPTKPSADATLPPGEWPTAETVTVSTTARS
jgi:tetrahydromethanopterin S-methyltransferase subunit B